MKGGFLKKELCKGIVTDEKVQLSLFGPLSLSALWFSTYLTNGFVYI